MKGGNTHSALLLSGACSVCRTPAEVLARAHPVIDAMLRAKTRQYSGTYKVRCVDVQQQQLLGLHHSFAAESSSKVFMCW
jgi:hypothetical protein